MLASINFKPLVQYKTNTMDDESLRTVTPDHKITPKEEKNRTIRGGDFGY
jgi:hypothetical protein